MLLTNDPNDLSHISQPVALAAGFFDGVHLGHRKVIEATIARARAIGGQAWALSLDPHPLAVLAPDRKPPLLTNTAQRLERLAASGLDGCLLMHFTRELSHQTAADFIQQVLCKPDWHPDSILAGDNWRFGAGGCGTVHTLPQLSRGRIRSIVVAPAMDEGEIVSSTRIRRAIAEGAVDTATRLLGAPYRISARVMRGRGMGKDMGYATANLLPTAEVLPPHGIYALWVNLAGQARPAVCSFGTAPTFPDQPLPEPVIEVHILDFSDDLYGQEMEIAFVKRLRAEERFTTRSELIAQIGRDVDDARAILTDPPTTLFKPAQTVQLSSKGES